MITTMNNPNPIAVTAISGGWHFTADDWDGLLQPLEDGDVEEVDRELRDISFSHIRRRHSPSRIRDRLASGPPPPQDMISLAPAEIIRS